MWDAGYIQLVLLSQVKWDQATNITLKGSLGYLVHICRTLYDILYSFVAQFVFV